MRVLFRIAVLLLSVVVGAALVGTLAERKMIYPLDATYVLPADRGLHSVEEVAFPSDGETLITWAAHPRPGHPVVLYFQGNAGNLAARSERFRRLIARGYGLFAPAYRGSSGSSGRPSELALLNDAETAYQALLNHFPTLNSDQVVLYGESLGTAVSIGLLTSPATNKGSGFGPSAAVILEARFTSIPDVARHHYPGIGALAETYDSTWDSLSRACTLNMPLLILHGTQDRLIPIEMGRQIFAAAPSREKHFFEVKGAGHTNLWQAETQSRLWQFIDLFALR